MLASGLTTLGTTVLLIVAGTFIAFAFITSIWIPRKHPNFPVNLPLFLTVCVVLFAAQMGTVYWVAETQEAETHETTEPGHGEPTEPEETEPTETETQPTETETEPEETESTETETEPDETEPEETEPTETETQPGGEGDVAAGKEVFLANCSACHTLADAGTSGSVGPNLDDAQPDFDLVVDRVTNGSGAMPAFGDDLTEQQIIDVATYVSSVAGQ